MKNLFTLTVFVLLAGSLLSSRHAVAQAPDKMSYQAVIRDTEGNLVAGENIGMKISIIQGTVEGTVVYSETRATKTNANGLVTFEIGGEGATAVTGVFAAIDWSDGPYFFKTETDPFGGADYTITGTSQLLSVPYAFHAKTAETISEPIVESDPVFEASPAAGIEAADIGKWDEAYSWGDHAGEGYLTEESDPLFTAWDKSTGIEITESQITDLQTYYLASNPDGFITAYIVTEEDVTAHESALSISESQIADLQSYLTSITGQSVGDLSDVDLTGIEAGKVLKYDAGEEKWVVADDLGLTEETDPLFTAWDKSTGIDITESQISDLKTYYLASNPDGFITAYIVTEEDVTAHESALSISESQIADLQSYLTSITGQSVGDLADVDLTGIEAGKVLKYDAVEDKWVVADDMGITEEEDPIFTSSEASKITDAGSGVVITDEERDKLAGIDGSETKVTAGTNITVTGTGTEADPYIVNAATGGATTYEVGDFAHGGIVFWVDETGQHGLVAAKEDQSTGVRWYAGTYGNTQAKGDGPFAGEANTSIIIAAQVAIGDDNNTYAARICNELQITEGGKTYGDWYLPSKEELNLMYINRTAINNTATANGGIAFASAYYWSSTESNNSYAWRQLFSYGNQYHNLKNYTLRVRAVRAF